MMMKLNYTTSKHIQNYLDEIIIDEDEVQMVKNLRSVNRKLKRIRPGFTGIERKN